MTQDVTPGEALARILTGYWGIQLLRTAVLLGLADNLASGSRNAEELAGACGGNAPMMRRLLRALVPLGVLTENADERYELTPMGQYLRSDTPGSMRLMILFNGGVTYQALHKLSESVLDGRSAFEHAHGMPFYEYLAQHPDEAAVMDGSMTQTAQAWFCRFMERYDLRGVGTLVDIGGGHGTLLAHILQANPAMRGILVDLPHVVAGSEQPLVKAGVADRCTVVGGDIFASVPESGDAYLLARVLFNWEDEAVITLLRNCRRAMRRDARLLVVDAVLPVGDRSRNYAVWDLSMAMHFGVGLRTEAKFRELFAAAGFTLTEIVPLQEQPLPPTAMAYNQFSLIEATPL